MSARAESERYTSVAIALHWAIALSIVGLIIAGLWMAQEDVEPTPLHFAVYQMHKSFGVAVLFLTVARLGWRAVNPPPPLPEGMSGFERTASHVVHWAFYGLMLALPVSGWAMVSASPTGVPTLLFNAVPWPHLPIPASEATEHTLKNAHELMAYGAGALIALHVAAACKHQFLARDGLIARMIPGGLFGRTRPPAPGLSTRFAAAAFAAPLAVFIAIAWIGRAPSSAEAASADVTPATAGAAASGGWVVDHAASRLAFAGVNSGQPFEGVFESWTAEITFDPGDLDAARVLVRVATGTAATGSSYNDSTLKQGDWFDVGANPDAVFESGAIRAAADGGYEAAGFLTLKGETTPLDLPFTVDIDGDVATAAGQAIIDRTSVGIGIQSDAGGDWVGKDVTVTFDITANRAE